MEISNDLFPIANFYKCAVRCFGQLGGGRSLMPCITVLPWSADSTMSQPVAELAIAHLGTYQHFIRLDLSANFPVPPIARSWYTIRTPSVEGWERR